jgi:glycosyltransferase involved in cell wall biosynthesis
LRVIVTAEHWSPHQVAAVAAAQRQFIAAGDELIPLEFYGGSLGYGWTAADKPRPEGWRCLFPGRQSTKAGEIARAVNREVKEKSADVLVLNGWYGLSTWYLAVMKRCRLVLVSDSNRWDRPRAWRKELPKRLLLRRMDAGFAAGTPQREYLQELGLPFEKITLGNDVVDNSLYSSIPLRSSPAGRRWVVGTAARLIPEKNLVAALEAIAQMVARHPDVQFEWQIAGRGPQDEELRRHAERRALPVVFRGFVQYHDIPAWYAGLDLYWQPSVYEPWGLVVNEAMAAGLPVLVCDRCGCARDLVTADNGWTHAADVPAMTQAWEQVLAERPQWPARGAASRRLIADWDLPRFARGLHEACRLARQS